MISVDRQTYFCLFANCFLVKGASRSVICDVQRQEIVFIPNDLYEVLSEHRGEKISEILNIYGVENEQTILEYFEFLLEKEFIFLIKEKEELAHFPAIDLSWDRPSLISNAIIDIDNLNHDYPSIIAQLEQLNCKDLQIRSYQVLPMQELRDLFKLLFSGKIKSAELVTKYDPIVSDEEYLDFCRRNLRLNRVIIHGAPSNRELPQEDIGYADFIFVTQVLTSRLNCGLVAPIFFSNNLPHFSESSFHNSCLNRKIAIDAEGNIKNCPSMPQSFGNIKDTTLAEALAHPDFKKYWNITKDQVKVCQDCEFRYICTDCRAYLEDPEDDYSKPLKCGYDPYAGQWAEWSTHPLKQRAIDYYGMREIL